MTYVAPARSSAVQLVVSFSKYSCCSDTRRPNHGTLSWHETGSHPRSERRHQIERARIVRHWIIQRLRAVGYLSGSGAYNKDQPQRVFHVGILRWGTAELCELRVKRVLPLTIRVNAGDPLICLFALDSKKLNGRLEQFLKLDSAYLARSNSGTAQSPPSNPEDRGKQECRCASLKSEAHERRNSRHVASSGNGIFENGLDQWAPARQVRGRKRYFLERE